MVKKEEQNLAGLFVSLLALCVSLLALHEARGAAALLREMEEDSAPPLRTAAAPTPDRILREWLYGERAER